MIQRIQSVYLLLAAIICVAFLFVPAGSNVSGDIIPEQNSISAALSIATAFLSLAAIFLFKNRKLQLRICFICIALLLVTMANVYSTITKPEGEHSISYFFATPLVAAILFFLASRAIRKDEELVKSMERFR
ncbi:MAG: DUF4293 domain-containing protein [Chitinophagales bacterium]